MAPPVSLPAGDPGAIETLACPPPPPPIVAAISRPATTVGLPAAPPLLLPRLLPCCLHLTAVPWAMQPTPEDLQAIWATTATRKAPVASFDG
jgi:hypothetical protein